ncbi:hypothetical protein F441_16361 [Phytophthora nicotianae CJ01A1]|uniref:Uncharacterized protein n=5 Tax=Phytophthora nicotianae TaxID=4792 RepID=W2PRC9_PHYN3|nr:hypothetical protein PPTG_23841 [Phytophthora nicotianae INRA-310]ETI37456.1 hypothetical protein F443_16547 [Phytophthora nicotianae P1569]ETK77679.1 hypothetical protein L915_16075 [Phytophthora nicotianae]ETO66232.1 hypothetical protein F444_16522 [Phytophthora nicotianae P1976]ETP07317.1 hypothetical protein F441_16361 [Phytophthora nicotianae CJ01A1]ETL31125.1 hypothetical protein L916_15967 [Phytophthora nicotianae]
MQLATSGESSNNSVVEDGSAKVAVRQAITTALRALTSTTSARQMSTTQYLLELACHCWAPIVQPWRLLGLCCGQGWCRLLATTCCSFLHEVLGRQQGKTIVVRVDPLAVPRRQLVGG